MSLVLVAVRSQNHLDTCCRFSTERYLQHYAVGWVKSVGAKGGRCVCVCGGGKTFAVRLVIWTQLAIVRRSIRVFDVHHSPTLLSVESDCNQRIVCNRSIIPARCERVVKHRSVKNNDQPHTPHTHIHKHSFSHSLTLTLTLTLSSHHHITPSHNGEFR